MSTYEHGKLYLYERAGKTEQAVRDSQGYFRDPTSGLLVSEGENARPAIVLDPEDADVKAVLRRGEYVRWHTGDPDGYVMRLAKQIRAQITPPEPPMEEPTEWGTPVTDDRDDWMLAMPPRVSGGPGVYLSLRDDRDGRNMTTWVEMENPRPYENPRQEPATAPQSDAQGSAGGIGPIPDGIAWCCMDEPDATQENR